MKKNEDCYRCFYDNKCILQDEDRAQDCIDILIYEGGSSLIQITRAKKKIEEKIK